MQDNDKTYLKPNLKSSEWSLEMAENIIKAWQRNYTQELYNHEWNFENYGDGAAYEKRRIHPLAATSVSDMLEQFCQFNYRIIFIGYFLLGSYNYLFISHIYYV